MNLQRISLDVAEIVSIKALLNEICLNCQSVEGFAFMKDAPVFASEIPRRIRTSLNNFKALERDSICTVSGFPINDDEIGPTPEHWNRRPGLSPTSREDMLLILLSSLLGELIGWATQQNGQIVHDVLPIRGHEYQQMSSGSKETILWHIEDAFHPYRSDYVALMCLRNRDQVPTTIASIDMVELDPAQVDILFEPRFIIRPDESHAMVNNPLFSDRSLELDSTLQAAYRNIELMHTEPGCVSVLFGNRQAPYIRIDPLFTNSIDPEGQAALDALIGRLDAVLYDVVLCPGDILFIDNYRAVHGRKAFQPRYDGTDRWLRRVNIARDLRKSYDARTNACSHIIFPGRLLKKLSER